LKVGDLVSIYSGQNDLLSPMVGLDPMAADFVIQGYNTPDASHQQFMVAQAPQCFHILPDLTLEAAGSYMLTLGTIYRALFTTLKIQPGRRIFVEGAATGTGLDAAGAVGVINRRDPRYAGIFTRVPEDPAKWVTIEDYRDQSCN
jgi:acrylyl-CoA reductase (NADPH)/3-hydroxypropionyl-CoA dehydratase/3-hydroxypropionyl-CoA synthetase